MNDNKLLGVYLSVSISFCLWDLNSQFMLLVMTFPDSPSVYPSGLLLHAPSYGKQSLTIASRLSQHCVHRSITEKDAPSVPSTTIERHHSVHRVAVLYNLLCHRILHHSHQTRSNPPLPL